MSDLIDIHIGALPWKPTPDTKLIKTFNYYDMPLSGILTQHGQDHLFRCVEGQVDPSNLWIYTPLEPADLELLAEADDLHAALTAITTDGRAVALAVNEESRGVVETFERSKFRPKNLDAVVQWFLEQYELSS
jgi:hypothetical protein